MVDPISAVAIATSAYKGLQVAITAGRELDEVATTLGKWFGAVSDFRKSEQEIKNPPLFKKMLYSGSVEQEALEIFAHTKKIAERSPWHALTAIHAAPRMAAAISPPGWQSPHRTGSEVCGDPVFITDDTYF